MQSNWITIKGQRRSIFAFSKCSGIPTKIIRARLESGWSGDEAVSIPMQPSKPDKGLSDSDIEFIKSWSDDGGSLEEISCAFDVSRALVIALTEGDRKVSGIPRKSKK